MKHSEPKCVTAATHSEHFVHASWRLGLRCGTRRDQLPQQNSRRESCLDPLSGNCQAWKQQDLVVSIAMSRHRRRQGGGGPISLEMKSAILLEDGNSRMRDWLCLGYGETRWDTKLDGFFLPASDAKLAAGHLTRLGKHRAALARTSGLFPTCLSVVRKRLVPGLWSFASRRAEWWSIVGDVGTLFGGPGKCQEGRCHRNHRK